MESTPAYDYDAQRWVTGPAATPLLRRQLEETLAVILSPEGPRYLLLVAKGVVQTVEQAAAEIRAHLAAL